MAKLHEIIAADKDRAKQASKLVAEAVTTFSKRQEHFSGYKKTLHMEAEDRQAENLEETSELNSTVAEKLDFVWETLERHCDLQITKACTNAGPEAMSQIHLNHIDVGTPLPATALMDLRRFVLSLRPMYEAIPTLPPQFEWERDEEAGPNRWRTKAPRTTTKTEKDLRFQEISPATQHHKAQVETWAVDKAVGIYKTSVYSGAVPVAEKAGYLKNIDDLVTAINEAIQRANQAEAVRAVMGTEIRMLIEGRH